MISNHNPWLGLKSYEENNRIYGRDKETEELSNIIISSFHSIVYGKSGIGKTSLLKAGVFPVLRYEDFFPIYIRLEHDSAQDDGIKSYLEQIENAINNPVQGVCINRNIDAEDINSLSDIFESYSITTTRGIELIPVFIFDQFEEIFTLNEKQNKNNITEFFRNLSDILNDNTIERNYRIVFCFREDYLYYIERYSETIPAFKRNRYSLQDLTRSEAQEVITKPQKNFVDSACADEILHNLSNESTDQVNATILSLYMSRLYEIVAESGKTSVTSDIIHQFGENIIESFYFDSIKSVSEKSVAYLEDRLLTGEGFRHHVTYNDAISSGVKPAEIGTLINSRVLTKDSRNGHEYIEFSHDVIAPIAKKHRDERTIREQSRKARMRMLVSFCVFAVSIGILSYVLWLSLKLETAEQGQKTAESGRLEEIRQKELIKMQSDSLARLNELNLSQKAEIEHQRDSIRKSLEEQNALNKSLVEQIRQNEEQAKEMNALNLSLMEQIRRNEEQAEEIKEKDRIISNFGICYICNGTGTNQGSTCKTCGGTGHISTNEIIRDGSAIQMRSIKRK